MKILITTGTGEGPTPMAAFDAALLAAGVANYNLIGLSSVIPASSLIQRVKYETPPEEYGHRLYLVMARHDAHLAGTMTWAGLGWTQEEATGRGLFVEIHGSDRRQVEEDICATLESMKSSRPIQYGPIQRELAGVECRGMPVCALVLAVYQSQGWHSLPG